MEGRTKLGRLVFSAAVSVAMAFAPTFAPGLASAWANEDAAAVPEWAVDDGSCEDAFEAQAALPTTYDLRDEGLVTPVKFQNPWGSCWAFGGIAAAETSILSAFGSTYEDSKLDLSERHLTYFALHPVTEDVDPAQVGEGMHTFDESPNAAFGSGGNPMYITTLFSQGVGPVEESLFPYRGKNATTNVEYFNEHPEEATLGEVEVAAKQYGMTVDQFLSFQANAAGKTVEELLEYYITMLRTSYEASPSYDTHDDWSIPAVNEDGTSNRLVSNGVVLKNGNILPEYWNREDNVPTTLNEEGLNAIKQELINGHGVSIMFHADQSGKYAANSDEGGKNFCQYAYEAVGPNHGVCIVGWDDTYAASNFTHTTDVNGSPLVGNDNTPLTEEQAIQMTTPPADGAWIVKNSWGSTADACEDELGNVVNRYEYGIKNEEGEYTGYFYLSYYDKTIQHSESPEFSADLGESGAFYTLQHDYMPAQGGFFATQPTEDVTSSANVFDIDEDIELTSVSTHTSKENMRVTFAVYVLNDNAQNPTDGTLAFRVSQNFQYGGFHRLDLDQPVKIGAGKRFSIVSTTSTLDDSGRRQYSASANKGTSKEYVEEECAKNNTAPKLYATAVVNKGESFLYSDGKWQDWSDCITSLGEEAEKYPIDNFSIKAYADPVENSEEPVVGATTLTYGGHVQTKGNLAEVSDGATCGTTGESKRLEAMWARASEGSVEYRAHVQGSGWSDSWSKDGEVAGTMGAGKRLEAIQMRLAGDAGDNHVWYRVHSQGFGWLGWAKDGEPAGTTGFSKRAEAYEAVILKGDEVPEGYDASKAAYVAAPAGRAHVQTTGWADATAGLLGTTGKAKRLEALSLEAAGLPWAGGVSYDVHAQGKGWLGAKENVAVAGTTGESRRLEAVRISLTGEAAEHLSVWYRVHSQSFGWLGWACDGADAGTTGLSKRAEAVEVQLLPKGTAPEGYDATVAALRKG